MLPSLQDVRGALTKKQAALELALEFSSEPMTEHVNLFERCCAEVRNQTQDAPRRIQQIEMASVTGSQLSDRQDAINHVLRYLERAGAFISAKQIDATVYRQLMELPLRELFANVGSLIDHETSRDWQLVLIRIRPVQQLTT
ncbi:MAG: hypothetical protein ABL908_01780 [Hyphomicrobium sp.]